MNSVIYKYKDLLSYFEKIILNTKEEKMLNFAKNSYLDFTKELAKLENNDFSIYYDKLDLLNIEYEKENDVELGEQVTDTNSIENVSENGFESYIKEIRKDEEISKSLDQFLEQLEIDFNEPNEIKIKTWVQNFFAFVVDKNLDKEKMKLYAKDLFKKYDKTLEYSILIDNYQDEKTDDNVKENTDSLEDKNTIQGDELKVDDAVEEIEDKELTEEEPLKILNIKKPNIKKNAKNGLVLLGLIGMGATIGIPATIISYGVYKLIKNGFYIDKLKAFLGKQGFKEENGKLIDKDGTIVDEEKIEKEKVGFLKKKLMNLGKFKDSGLFKNSYKKNRLTSMLLNMKLAKGLKNRFKKNGTEEAKLSSETEDIQKGMGKC